jgi:GNAT superfamily N-acetyltransferase
MPRTADHGAADDCVVRPYVSEDRPRLVELMRQVWPHKARVEARVDARWWWQWEAPPLYVVEDPASRALIGLCAYLPVSLRAGGRELPGAWFVDFYVRPESQGLGLGQRLTRVVQDRFAITASLSQSAMAYRVFQKLGWRARTRVALYVNPFPVRWMFPKPTKGLRVSTQAMDPALPAGDLDALWARVRDTYGLIALRTGAAVLTRYASHGARQYVLLCCYREAACVGYMIVRVVPPGSTKPGAPQGLIVDYLVHPDDAQAFGALLSEAASILIDRGVRRIYCLSTAPRCQHLLGSRGFLSPATPLMGRALRGNWKWLTYNAKPAQPVADPASWFLTMGDCDLDYAWFQD